MSVAHAFMQSERVSAVRSKSLFICLFLFMSCSNNDASNEQRPTGNDSISLEFHRISSTGLDPIQVVATINKKGIPSAGLTPSVSLTKGSLSAISDNGDGSYTFTITPTETGEYPVTVSYADISVTRTPIVLMSVHADWDQPMSVPGYVNTEGYEDGVTITPDGEYLFVQTGPQYFSGLFVMQASRANGGCGGATSRLTPNRCNHPWIDNTIGPYVAPERPGFFDGRYSGTTILHNANSWGIGVDQSPNYAISTMFYGFKRQSDGTFKEPFYVAFNDLNDGIVGPFGLSFMMNGDGTATTLFTFNDPTDPDKVDFDNDGIDDAESYFDVYKTRITLGQNNNLGDFVYSGTPETPPVRGTIFNSTLVDFGKTGLDGIAGTQGNSHLYAPGGIVKSIWIDDEFDQIGVGDSRDISVHILTSGDLDNGTWAKVTLPSNINGAEPNHEIQPFFDGNGLYFALTIKNVRNHEIFYSAYSGTHDQAGYSNNANWATPVRIVEIDTAVTTPGRIISLGEPTIGVYNGETYLYFVYVLVRAIDTQGTLIADVNLQAGFMKKK